MALLLSTRSVERSGLSEDAVKVCAALGAFALGHLAAVGDHDPTSGLAFVFTLHAVVLAIVGFAGFNSFGHVVLLHFRRVVSRGSPGGLHRPRLCTFCTRGQLRIARFFLPYLAKITPSFSSVAAKLDLWRQ